MERYATVQYLANLVSLIDFHRSQGQGVPNKWVIAEWNKVNDEFIKTLKDEHDETRQSEGRPSGGLEDRTGPSQSQPRSGKPTREPPGEPSMRSIVTGKPSRKSF